MNRVVYELGSFAMHNHDVEFNGLSPERASMRLRRPGPIRFSLSDLDELDELEGPAAPLKEQRHRQPQFLNKNQGKGSKGSKRPKGKKTITLLGDFPNQWNTTLEEIGQMESNQWNPTTDDMDAVSGTNSAAICNAFTSLLSAILRNPLGSVKRVNIVSHGNSDNIAFAGQVKRATGTVFLEIPTALNSDSLAQVANAPWFEIVVNKKTERFTLKDVLKRFGRDPEIYFYACNSGATGNAELLQDMANTFQAKILGFSKYLKFEPKFTKNPPKINRKRVKINGSSDPPVSSVTKLTPDVAKSPTQTP
jgi:hypothetical protein